MSTVQVYSKSNCPYCVLAKNLLSDKGVNFQEINLDGKDQELKELRERTGMRTVPQIFVDDKLIGGYQDLAALDVKGELDQILGA
ncbi:MAG: glutaredoxin 3 [Bdellovibrionales bacterium]